MKILVANRADAAEHDTLPVDMAMRRELPSGKMSRRP
jgi:hypothetical protein